MKATAIVCCVLVSLIGSAAIFSGGRIGTTAMSEEEMAGVLAGAYEKCENTEEQCLVAGEGDPGLCAQDPQRDNQCTEGSNMLLCEDYQPDPPQYGPVIQHCVCSQTPSYCEESNINCSEVTAKACHDSEGTGECGCWATKQTGVKVGQRVYCE